ncbi:hypothetical protein C8R46DRAFT_1235348 [Mycena filopes]|nr:hypothetical protein C8R46DRAFT_1235348 [Mycena filopes]
MNTETYTGEDSNTDDPELVTAASGPFFPRSHHFTINGGTFNSVTSPDVPSDFRRIPLGDIDLQLEMRADELQRDDNADADSLGPAPRKCVRRVYSARVQDPKTDMTAVIYEGDHAEQVSRFDSNLIATTPISEAPNEAPTDEITKGLDMDLD